MSDFDKSFEELMEKIAVEAIEAANLADKVDAAKVLQPYYALRKKHRPPGVEPGTTPTNQGGPAHVDTRSR